jgi:IclR helix-turn-helix domain
MSARAGGRPRTRRRPEPAGPDVTITLTPAQIAEVAQQGSGAAEFRLAFAGLDDMSGELVSAASDRLLSRSLLRALLVLVAFPADGGYKRLTDVAEDLAMAPSTVHRYAATWVAVGLLEQDRRSRTYRRALPRLATREVAAGGGSDAA